MTNPLTMTIRTKKLGVLMRSARLSHGKSLEECATAIGVTVEELEAFEMGEHAASLPELELLAYHLQIPLDLFWGNELLKGLGRTQPPDAMKLISLRQSTIGVLIQKARNEADLTVEELANQAGITTDQLQAYESGEQAVPVPQLENLAKLMNKTMNDFQDKSGPAGTWFEKQRLTKAFLGLPEELQEFASKPINQPYLEAARRLSEMQVDKLRSLAEGLLEITL